MLLRPCHAWLAIGLVLAAAPDPLPAQNELPGLKSETTALGLSILGTVVPFGFTLLTASEETTSIVPGLISLGGLLVGPSLGHFYAGRPGRALVGIGIRTAALVGLAAGFGASWNGNSGGDELMLASAAVGVGVMVWDILGVRGSVRRHNAKLNPARPAVVLTPAIDRRSVGVSGRITF